MERISKQSSGGRCEGTRLAAESSLLKLSKEPQNRARGSSEHGQSGGRRQSVQGQEPSGRPPALPTPEFKPPIHLAPPGDEIFGGARRVVERRGMSNRIRVL